MASQQLAWTQEWLKRWSHDSLSKLLREPHITNKKHTLIIIIMNRALFEKLSYVVLQSYAQRKKLMLTRSHCQAQTTKVANNGHVQPNVRVRILERLDVSYQSWNPYVGFKEQQLPVYALASQFLCNSTDTTKSQPQPFNVYWVLSCLWRRFKQSVELMVSFSDNWTTCVLFWYGQHMPYTSDTREPVKYWGACAWLSI